MSPVQCTNNDSAVPTIFRVQPRGRDMTLAYCLRERMPGHIKTVTRVKENRQQMYVCSYMLRSNNKNLNDRGHGNKQKCAY